MSDSNQESEHLAVYAVRITARAKRDIQEALLRMADLSGSPVARSWIIELYDAFATLGTLPRRCPVATEANLFPSHYEVRQLQYRRAGSTAVYRILFRVRDETEDGPVVSILHVRHAARKPMTRREAKEIQGQEAE